MGDGIMEPMAGETEHKTCPNTHKLMFENS